jgi:hypothetical protein
LLFYIPNVAARVFRLVGSYFAVLFGRKRILVWSILLYSVSACAAGFSTSLWQLLIFRCTTLIGVSVEFVAATTWLAELFANPKRRIFRAISTSSSANSVNSHTVIRLQVRSAAWRNPAHSSHGCRSFGCSKPSATPAFAGAYMALIRSTPSSNLDTGLMQAIFDNPKSGSIQEEFRRGLLDPEERLRIMDESGVDRHLLSLTIPRCTDGRFRYR